MVSWAAVIGMSLVALGMVLTPGPNMIYLVSRSISQGWRAGMISLGGTMVGFVVYMTLANIGVAAVFLVVPWLYIALKFAGAAYLLWLAWKTLRPGGLSVFEPSALARDSRGRLFRMGLLTNLLNPKAAIMYLALIPQFIDTSAGNVMLQGFLLGGVQITVSLVVNALLIVAAGGIAVFLGSRPTWIRWQRRITGTLLGAVGVKLAIDAPAPASA
ncbi:LysE family translocator [Agromyces atrinae]|uniref:LysE family translocator n=1 Tax=Agromyces atrinae TaxID=592376 RepID=UPI001F573F20|nr:LysE family translocator [Agromyces atrinae]MCI2956109.1 LysE family translocator [Agromyces atrinae]